MKRIKMILAAGAFVLAIGAAFATKTANDDLLMGYAQLPNTCQLTSVPSQCDTSHSNICTVGGITYYENQNSENPTRCVDFLTKP